MRKIDARSIPSAAQERVRYLAVKAVLGGKKQIEVARIFGVTRQAVRLPHDFGHYESEAFEFHGLQKAICG